MRLLLSLFVVLAMAGCDYFAPPYQQQADERAVRGYEGLSLILAKAELGSLTRATSFAGEAEGYAKVISDIETARLVVGGAAPRPNSPAEEAARLLDRIVGRCLSAVKLLAEQHKEFGLDPEDGIIAPTRLTCDLAVKAIQARKG